MPRENFDALTIDVTCKQIAGRALEPMSGYWQTLFPSPQARIDGRVPTAQSIKYLVSIRMNSSKELIVVNFTPRSDDALVKFNELIDFLIGKEYVSLVFYDAPFTHLHISTADTLSSSLGVLNRDRKHQEESSISFRSLKIIHYQNSLN